MKRSDAFSIFCLFVFMCSFLWAQTYVSQDITLEAIEATAPKPFEFPNFTHEVPPVKKASVVGLVAEKAYAAGIDPVVALRIAWCESRYDSAAKNSSSSASGVFQFINKTWKKYCAGNRFDAEDNIDCFVKLYKRFPGWWSCKA